MQFFENAPNIPDELLEAHRENKLVFICGAGISTNSGLELFKGLTNQVIQDLGVVLKHDEAKELEVEAYDKVFSLLERDHRFGSHQVRNSVKKNLTTPADPNVEVHKSILQLSKSTSNELKLITTNFDLLFEECDNNIQVYRAPLLPIPKRDRWSGLVHLHGCIDDDLRNLVLTSSDFGIAYLTERWASRFITELFSHYTVLFIGYSVDDPVMKYLIDAIAAERKKDSRIGDAFAFVASENKSEDDIRSDWEAKNIHPVIYDSSVDNHSLLNKTLKAWAKSWSGGLESKHNIVSKVGRNNPNSIPENEIEKLIWAISSDITGSTAKTFSKLGKDAPIEWLHHFQKSGLLGIQDEDSGLNSKLVDRNFYDYSTPTLSKIQQELMIWIVCHLDKMILVEWLIDKGFILHPALRWRVQYTLHQVQIPKGFRKFWSVASHLINSNRNEISYLDTDFYKQEFTPLYKQTILAFFDPILIPKKTYRSLFADLYPQTEEINFERLSDVANFDLESNYKHLSHNISSLKAREDWRYLNEELLFDLLQKLKYCLDLYTAIDRATEYYDPTYVSRQSIEKHEQNHNRSLESKIIELIVEGIEFSIEDNLDLSPTIQFVFSINYPVFRRVGYFISRKMMTECKPILFSKIIRSPNKWLWDYELRIEQSKTLSLFWYNLNRKEKDQLELLILQGSDKSNFKPNISEEEFQEAKERSIWKILSIINFDSNSELRKNTVKTLEELSKKHGWVYSGTERENFGVWSSGASWVAEQLATEDFEELSTSDIAKLLCHTEDKNFEGKVNSLRNLASKTPGKAGDVLNLFRTKKGFNKAVYEAYFYGYSPNVDAGVKIYNSISELKPKEINESIHSLTRFLSESAKKTPIESLNSFLKSWDVVFEQSVLKKESNLSKEDKFNIAHNHPLGNLTISLFNYLGQENYDLNSGLPSVIKSRFVKIFNNENESIKNAITILTSRVGFLQYVDPIFTQEYIYPLFDFNNPYSFWAWEGYLWNPYITPEIYKNIKEPYSQALTKKSNFSREASENLPQIVAVISVDLPDLISLESSKKLMDKLDSEDLSKIVRWLIQKLQSNPDRVVDIWCEIMQPWLNESWPKKIAVRSEYLTSELIDLILFDIEIFESAYDTFQEFLTPLERTYSTFSDILEKEIIQKYPLKLLLLLNKITPDKPVPYNGFGKLNSLLESILEADEELEQKPEYLRLKEIALIINR